MGWWLLAWIAGCGSGPVAPPPPADAVYTCATHATPVVGCFVRLDGGTGLQGAQHADPDAPAHDPAASPDEGPVHEVTLHPFWIQREEVTVTGFEACLGAGACRAADVLDGAPSGRGLPDPQKHPIRGVSWAGADAYCRWIHARLPTEAEWERAARGVEGRRWPWGATPDCGPFADPTPGDAGVRSALVADADGTRRCVHAGPSHLDAHGPETPEGLRFLAGNVREWVADWAGPYPRDPVRDPSGPDVGVDRITRGGAYTDADPLALRTTARVALPPDTRRPDVGFRCATDDPATLPDPRSFVLFPELPP